ncbi:hypothetical protein OG875_30050 [Streptomyces sp. NBC_01498]|uniref:hypothetical protein n=1 Tax=Streptomyces sp. NBC_01498 TaxID=2975870 RepID=UPI002E7C26A0|nr:hypothetical protein [Streptomyces sp. NBC_01498]WTL28457.1 hypothetical protein OG875_30050 [Streptomyces sp. NBC_01498]
MNEFSNLQALPDGEAELRVVVRLSWEDVAALGQEAGRLAKQMQRPVGLDEAVAHRLRTRAVTPAKPTQEPARAAAVAPAPVSSLAGRTPGEHARQAIEKINGTESA